MQIHVIEGGCSKRKFLDGQAEIVHSQGYGTYDRCAIGNTYGDFTAMDFNRSD